MYVLFNSIFDKGSHFCYWLHNYDTRNNTVSAASAVHLLVKLIYSTQALEEEIKYKIEIIFLLEAFSYNLSLLSGAVNYLLNLTQHYNIWNLVLTELFLSIDIDSVCLTKVPCRQCSQWMNVIGRLSA